MRRNAKLLLEKLDGAELWAVVKANGYGHGAADVAGAALNAGATALCVATVPEGLALRRDQPSARMISSTVRETPVQRVVTTAAPGPTVTQTTTTETTQPGVERTTTRVSNQ